MVGDGRTIGIREDDDEEDEKKSLRPGKLERLERGIVVWSREDVRLGSN